MKFWLFTALLLVAPGLASAAGFAKDSIFLSKTPVTEGETVLIHAVVANEASIAFTGEVVIREASGEIGSVAVSIAPGGANAVSVSWKPAAGSHAVTAELTAKDGTVAASESTMFTINAKPKPASAGGSSSEIDSSADIQQKITEFSPAVGNASAPVFATLDSARMQAATLLDNGINWAKDKTGGKKPTEVLGSATSSENGGVMNTVWFVLTTILLYIFSILRFVVGNAGIFYPAFAILFFYILWRVYKRMRRPQFPVYE